MIRSYILLAALGLATAACGSSGNEQTARNEANGQTETLASATGPDGVVPGGAIDVLRREGWRVENIQQADASTVAEPTDSVG